MNEELRFDKDTPILSRVIKTPDLIAGEAVVAALIDGVLANPQSAPEVLRKLSEELSAADLPRGWDKERMLRDMNFLASAVPDALSKKEIGRAVYMMQAAFTNIELAKLGGANQSETARIQMHGKEVVLEKINAVFNPSPHGLFFAENIRVAPGETVIDIGTGSGFLAILASRLGGKASATDITSESIEMAKFNGVVNGTPIDARQGTFFATFDGTFDVIIANLPQKLILPETKKDASAVPVGVVGGNAGNEILLSFLELAKDHMHSGSRLYIQVYSLTDHKVTLQKIAENYSFTQLAKREFIEDDIIERNPQGYRELQKDGTIDITKKDGHWWAYETAYELKLRPSSEN